LQSKDVLLLEITSVPVFMAVCFKQHAGDPVFTKVCLHIACRIIFHLYIYGL